MLEQNDALEDVLKKYVDSVMLPYIATIAKQSQATPSVCHSEQPEQKLRPADSDDVTETPIETLVITTINSTDHPSTVPPGTVPPGTVLPGTVHPGINNSTSSAESEVKLKKLQIEGCVMKPLHTVYIGGLDYHTSGDALRAHLMDLNVDNITHVS